MWDGIMRTCLNTTPDRTTCYFSVISKHYNLPPNARNTAGAFIGGGATISRRTANYLSESTKDDGTEYIYGTVLR